MSPEKKQEISIVLIVTAIFGPSAIWMIMHSASVSMGKPIDGFPVTLIVMPIIFLVLSCLLVPPWKTYLIMKHNYVMTAFLTVFGIGFNIFTYLMI